MLAVALLIAFPFSSAFAQQTPPDLILFNGRAFTSNAGQPYVEVLAIRGERIFAVGTSKEIVIVAGKETRRIDLRGHSVIPGINDAHQHLRREGARNAVSIAAAYWLRLRSLHSSYNKRVPAILQIVQNMNTCLASD